MTQRKKAIEGLAERTTRGDKILGQKYKKNGVKQEGIAKLFLGRGVNFD